MITPDYARLMAAYNAEINRRLYAAASGLPDADRRADGGVFWKSIHGTLCHILWADRVWLSRFGACERPEATLPDSAAIVEGFEDLWTQRQDFDATLCNWAEALTPPDLDGDLRWFSGISGRELTRPRALLVVHIFNHQTHHRGQVHALLTRAGLTTGDTDLPFVLP